MTETKLPGARVHDQDRTAELILRSLDPGDERSLTEIAKELGFPMSTAKRILAKLRERFSPLAKGIEEIQTDDLREMSKRIAWRLGMSMERMSDEEIDAVPFYQRSVSFGIYTDKHLLLSNRPTQILSVQELGQMPELIRLLLGEAQRRGMGLPEQDPVTLEVGAGQEPDRPGYQLERDEKEIARAEAKRDPAP